MPTKFIITLDQATANKLIAVGFKLVVQNGGKYTFLNQPPKNFNFEQLDKKNFSYTNVLTF